jgi:tetratricopeptide (TPR) repeat protein
MRRALLSLLVAGALCAQTGQPTKDDLNQMIEQLRQAVHREDWAEASRLSIRINAALLVRNRGQATPTLELQHLQVMAGSDPIRRNPYLSRLAKAAFAAGDYQRALDYADEALAASKHGVFWWDRRRDSPGKPGAGSAGAAQGRCGTGQA